MILNISPTLLEAYIMQHYLRLFYKSTYEEAKVKINHLIETFKNSNIPENEQFCEYTHQLEKRDCQFFHHCRIYREINF